MIEQIPPGLPLILGCLLAPWLPRPLKSGYLLVLPLVTLAHVWALPLGHTLSLPIFGGTYTLSLVRVDELARIFATIFSIAALLSQVYALHVDDDGQHVAGNLYAGSAIAAVFAGDLITLFVYWEATAISSVFLIWARRTERAYAAGMRYLVIQVGSGVLLLAGTLLHLVDTGSIAFDHLGLVSVGTGLILVAFGIKAAFPLLHNWLQDSYPEATITGTVYLSSFTTKLAVYALARGFAGTEILIPIGAAMTAFPVLYALLENDLRRVLAYSLNNQLGFMVVGVGIGTELALNGTAAHAFAHILYKGLLFMCIGAVLARTGTAKASELGGLYKSMPWTLGFCVVGTAAISALPLFSGFVSKSMILTAAEEEHLTATYLVLLLAWAGIFFGSDLKILFFTFFGRDRGHRVREAPLNMLVAMGGAALFCFGLGVFYPPLYAMLPFDAEYSPYTTTHVVTTLQVLLFATLTFAVLVRTGIYPSVLPSRHLDFDWTYRRAAPAVVRIVTLGIVHLRQALSQPLARLGAVAARALASAARPPGALGEPWGTGTTSLCAALLLGAVLIFYYA